MVSFVTPSCFTWSWKHRYLRYLATVAGIEFQPSDLCEKSCEATQIQIVDLLHLFYIVVSDCVMNHRKFTSNFAHLASGAMSGMLTNLTSEASSKPHGISRNSYGIPKVFLGIEKKVKLVDISVDI